MRLAGDQEFQAVEASDVGNFTTGETEEHIFVKELKAVHIALRAMAGQGGREPETEVFLGGDNMAAVHGLQRGYSGTSKGMEIIREVWELVEHNRWRLEVRWLPGSRNIADAPSRGQALITSMGALAWDTIHGKCPLPAPEGQKMKDTEEGLAELWGKYPHYFL